MSLSVKIVLETTASGDLKIYRDCAAGNANFDIPQSTPALLTIRDVNGALFATFDAGAPLVQKIDVSINSACIKTPNDICLEVGTYATILTLPPKVSGYYIIYQRCCRNNTINNLLVPRATGSTYFTKIPSAELFTNNNSPRFLNFPPIFLCQNLDFMFIIPPPIPITNRSLIHFSRLFRARMASAQ